MDGVEHAAPWCGSGLKHQQSPWPSQATFKELKLAGSENGSLQDTQIAHTRETLAMVNGQHSMDVYKTELAGYGTVTGWDSTQQVPFKAQEHRPGISTRMGNAHKPDTQMSRKRVAF